jgi:hypothetical protein
MNFSKRFLPVFVLTVLFVTQCTKEKSTEPESRPQPVKGKITAAATGITGQNGYVLAVMAYDSDWSPGSDSPVIAGFMVNISSNDFSFTQNLHLVDAQAPGGYSLEDKVFEPKTYSVVFFVAAPGNPPQYFSEVRVAVNGDVAASAPDWAGWVHP